MSAFLSGCLSSFGAKLQEDASLPQIDSINTLADVSSVGFEWKFLDNEHIKGFVIYRAQAKDNQKLQKIATIPNRFATHLNPGCTMWQSLEGSTCVSSQSKSQELQVFW